MNKFIVVGAGVAVLVAAGCSDVTELTRERVARSETAVQQAQQLVGNSEAGALELQKAKEQQAAAQEQLKEKNGQAAEHFAAQSQLTAELATAKAQSAQARKAADELTASIETLRQEAARRLTP